MVTTALVTRIGGLLVSKLAPWVGLDKTTLKNLLDCRVEKLMIGTRKLALGAPLEKVRVPLVAR